MYKQVYINMIFYATLSNLVRYGNRFMIQDLRRLFFGIIFYFYF